MKTGDSVLFHFIPEHACKGEGDCECAKTETVARPAVVTFVFEGCGGAHPDDADNACEACEHIARLAPLRLEVAMMPEDLSKGYSPIQSQSPRATGSPPESGSWTSPTFTAALGDGVASKR